MNESEADKAARDYYERDDERRRAAHAVLVAIRHPLVLMAIPSREEALKLARVHGLTAADIIMAAITRAESA